jgi:hypothetical protein
MSPVFISKSQPHLLGYSHTTNEYECHQPPARHLLSALTAKHRSRAFRPQDSPTTRSQYPKWQHLTLECLHRVSNNPISSAKHNNDPAQLQIIHQMASQSCDRDDTPPAPASNQSRKSQADHQCSSANLSSVHHKRNQHMEASTVTELITEHACRRRQNHLRRKQWI